MILFKDFLNEALKITNPSSPEFRFFRDQYKNWNREKYKLLFQSFKDKSNYELDKNSYRLYFPLKKKTIIRPPSNNVVNFIHSKGFDIIDYSNGIITKQDSKGKLVTNNLRSVLSKYKQHDLESEYIKDPHIKDVLSDKIEISDYWVVISRHPYDIIGMSTDRDWISCMNIERDQAQKYLPMDIKQGTLVAYLISPTDKNIQTPLARVSIRPYIEEKEGDIILGVSNKVYYNYQKLSKQIVDLFSDKLISWVDQVHDNQNLQGVFKLKPGLYQSESDETKSFEFKNHSDKLEWKKFLENKNIDLNTIKSEKVLKAILKTQFAHYMTAGKYRQIKNPPDWLQDFITYNIQNDPERNIDLFDFIEYYNNAKDLSFENIKRIFIQAVNYINEMDIDFGQDKNDELAKLILDKTPIYNKGIIQIIGAIYNGKLNVSEKMKLDIKGKYFEKFENAVDNLIFNSNEHSGQRKEWIKIRNKLPKDLLDKLEGHNAI